MFKVDYDGGGSNIPAQVHTWYTAAPNEVIPFKFEGRLKMRHQVCPSINKCFEHQPNKMKPHFAIILTPTFLGHSRIQSTSVNCLDRRLAPSDPSIGG